MIWPNKHLIGHDCYDCGSPFHNHHTLLCGLSGPTAIRDLSSSTPTVQWWDRVVPAHLVDEAVSMLKSTQHFVAEVRSDSMSRKQIAHLMNQVHPSEDTTEMVDSDDRLTDSFCQTFIQAWSDQNADDMDINDFEEFILEQWTQIN